MSLKDRLDEEPEKAEGWRPEEGDELIGKVVRFNIRKMDEPDRDDYPVVTVQQEDGTKLAFHAFHTVARSQIEDEGGVCVGDEIAIRYLGMEEGERYSYHNYRLVVEHLTQPELLAAAPEPGAKKEEEDIPF
jgi:hypothetical protein